MKQTLTLKLSQRLTLTPQLKQSLKLLQLSSLDLENEIQNCLDTNPLLERDGAEDAIDSYQTSDKEVVDIKDHSDSLLTSKETELIDFSAENYQNDIIDHENHSDTANPWQSSDDSWSAPDSLSNRDNSTPNNIGNGNEFTQFVSEQETLFDHLYWQILMTPLSDKDKLIARSLLHCLDDEGYLTLDLNEIKDMFDESLDVEIDEVQAVLNLIKTLEPAGVGARNLQERLLFFLQQMPQDALGLDAAITIVQNHLDLVAAHNILKLKKVLKIDERTLSNSLNIITRLNPRIATQFKSDQVDHIVPDIIVKQDSQQWCAFINPDNQSKLRINQLYANMLKSKIDDADTEYIQTNLQQAKMFIKGLMSRYDTLLLVSQAIVERQQKFFEHGEHGMRPMILQDIANELDLHESTISRATSGKYLLSSRGVYELKHFFSSALSSTDGSKSSSIAIRSSIKSMVDNEPKDKPLSDNKIAIMLEQQGHIVARRTVAKYRENMQIAPSSQRKSLDI